MNFVTGYLGFDEFEVCAAILTPDHIEKFVLLIGPLTQNTF